MARFCRRLRAEARDDEGSVTLEMALWTPVILGLVGAFADITLIHTLDAQLWHVAADTARRMSLEELTTATAPDFARAALPEGLRAAAVITALDGGDGGDVSLTIAVPTSAISMVGLYSVLIDGDVVATLSMTREGSQVLDFSDFVGLVGAGAPAGGT